VACGVSAPILLSHRSAQRCRDGQTRGSLQVMIAERASHKRAAVRNGAMRFRFDDRFNMASEFGRGAMSVGRTSVRHTAAGDPLWPRVGRTAAGRGTTTQRPIDSKVRKGERRRAGATFAHRSVPPS
jgi:hypothetical protein